MAHSSISDAVMANVLNVQAQDSIVQLAAAGWPIRRISRHLGLDRKIIRRYLRHPPDPDAPPPDSKSPTISTAGNEAAPSLAPASLATGFPADPGSTSSLGTFFLNLFLAEKFW
jgi:hypothetical protein